MGDIKLIFFCFLENTQTQPSIEYHSFYWTYSYINTCMHTLVLTPFVILTFFSAIDNGGGEWKYRKWLYPGMAPVAVTWWGSIHLQPLLLSIGSFSPSPLIYSWCGDVVLGHAVCGSHKLTPHRLSLKNAHQFYITFVWSHRIHLPSWK